MPTSYHRQTLPVSELDITGILQYAPFTSEAHQSYRMELPGGRVCVPI